MIKKPGTAVPTGRPAGRSKNRTANKSTGGRKNSRVICEGNAYQVSAMSKTRESQHGVNLIKIPSTKASDASIVVAQKDGFFTHKRGHGAYSSKTRDRSNDFAMMNTSQEKTMTQLAKKGAAQAMASGRLDTDDEATSELTFKNDTTAMSDVNSLQNFSYYGRRFQDRQPRQPDSPIASDAVSLNNPKYKIVMSAANKGIQSKLPPKGSHLGNTSADTMSENQSYMAGYSRPPAAEYHIEEKMNKKMMKQFQPMFSNEDTSKNPSRTDANTLLNSISDFSQLNDGGGTKSRAQLFQQAKETLLAQRQLQTANKTAINFNSKIELNERNASAPRIHENAMNRTAQHSAQNFIPRKTTAKVLPTKLPPRSGMSPALTSLKSHNLGSKQQVLIQSIISQPQTTAKKQETESPIKENLYFAHQTRLNTSENNSEIVYKRGARSISKRRESAQNLLNNLVQTETIPLRKQQENDSGSKKNLLASESKKSFAQHTEKRKQAHLETCRACQNKDIDGHDHSVSGSLDRRLRKFHENFNPSGHCKQHNAIGCAKCSLGSSKGSRVSSLDLNRILAGAILKKHRAAPRSEISGVVSTSIAKSVTRQIKRGQNMSQGIRNSKLQKSAQDSSGPMLRIKSLTRGVDGDMSLYDGMQEVRRSTKNAEVRNLTGQLMAYGKSGNRPSGNILPKPSQFTVSEIKVNITGMKETRNDSSDSRGMSEYVDLKSKKLSKIPNFSRIFSAKTSSIERQTLQNKLQQKDHDGLLDEGVKKLVEDWEGDPNDPNFWQKLENENSQTKLRKKKMLRGQQAETKQLDVLDKQSNVFKNLKETVELNSARTSSMGFGAKGSFVGTINKNMVEISRRSNTSFFQNTLMQGEHIQTEIDQNEESTFMQNPYQHHEANNRLLQDPSRAVLTDYDITDEVGQMVGLSSSIRHQINFRDKNQEDKVLLDGNIAYIEDPSNPRNQQKLLQKSGTARQIDDLSIQRQLHSGKTVSTQHYSFPMEFAEIQSAKQQLASISQITSGFPENDDCLNKDSEDAESFDEEKQKIQVLKELEDAEGDDMDFKPVIEFEEDDKEKINETDDEQEERRKLEIKQKTLANVIMYDDYLETQTQKEIERQSQMNISPKNYRNDSMKLGEVTLEKTKSLEKLDQGEISLAESIKENNLRNARPKTRGEPVIKNLDQYKPTGDISSKNQFSARRKTHDSSDTGNTHQLHKQSNYGPNSTMKHSGSPFMDPSQLVKSPDKRTLGFGAQSKGMITSEAGGRSFTNFASSLKEDDMMISSSQVDPQEKSNPGNSRLGGSSRTKGGFAGNIINTGSIDQPAIQEESSSLRSVSPLTENSQSRKSNFISDNPTVLHTDQAKLTDQIVYDSIGLPPKDGRPPKSPFAITSKKVPISIVENSSSVRKIEPPETLQPVESRASEANFVSFAGEKSPEPQNQQIQEQKQPYTLSSRNPDLQAFLDYEDSEDDDFGAVIQKKPAVQRHTKNLTTTQISEEVKPQNEVITLSPQQQRHSSLAKNNSAMFVPNAQFLQSNPIEMPKLTPFEKLHPPAKTPNTGVSSKKIKAIQVEDKMKTGQVPPLQMPRTASIEDASVNEQLDKIDYNQSNDGMSASFYRNQDQWIQMQQLNQHNSLRSHRTSRDSNRQNLNQTEIIQVKPELESKAARIAMEAAMANQQVQELRKSTQALIEKPIPTRDEELRTSGQATTGYSRPQGYVKKMLHAQSKSNLNVGGDTSQERIKEEAPDMVARSNSKTRPNALRSNSSIMSDSKSQNKNSQVNKKQQFFAKHKDSISSDVAKTINKRESSDTRQASRDRLYNQETIASILKRNPELGFNPKDKKPPAAPARKAKKKPVPPPPEPPKEDPPEEPLPQSPRILQLPIEASVPNQESVPTTIPLPMRFPEDPPTEPSAIIMPNLYCPADPDTPYNYEIEPREEELHFAPLEPLSLFQAKEPEEPPFPDRMIKSQTNEYYSDKLEDPELFIKAVEPAHDDEPILEYPKQMNTFILPPQQPGKFEEHSIVYPDEPFIESFQNEEMPNETEQSSHYLTHDDLFKTHEMSIQCNSPEEESKQEESKHLYTIEEEPSDEDNFSVHSSETVNKVNVGIQTNEAHFRKVTQTEEFLQTKREKMESLDWTFSPIFDEIHFAKEKKTIGGRKLMTSIATQIDRTEDGGNQVEESQILQETAVQILSQIECEYNVDQLKRKIAGKDAIEDERCSELYRLGLNTLKALMLGLRLEKEWEFQSKQQYVIIEERINAEETIKLLTRNKKMYEAKTLIQRLLKMIIERDRMVEEATRLEQTPSTAGGTSANIPLRQRQQPVISKEQMVQIKRLSTRITSQINTLQEEHRIFKRPFILKGQDYLQQIQTESEKLENLITKKFFVDETGTTGTAMSVGFGKAGEKP